MTIEQGLDPLRLIDGARRAIGTIDPDVPLAAVRTMQNLVDRATAEARFAVALLSGFALAACLLAALGLAGLTTYLVGSRRRELGVRIALGATSARIFGDVVREGARLALVGATVGLGCTLATVRLLNVLLFRVAPFDPVTITLAPLILVAIVLLACATPALRATRLDPTDTLRAD